MSKFTGKPVTVNRSAAEISDRFADLTQIQEVVDRIPEEERQKLGKVEFTTDSIIIGTAQMGDMTLKVTERNEQRIKFEAIGSPVPLQLVVDLEPKSETETELKSSIEVQIPMMLRPLVAPHMQKAVDMLSQLIAQISER